MVSQASGDIQPSDAPAFNLLRDVADDTAYGSWRRQKLDGYPATLEQFCVAVKDPAAPSRAEISAVVGLCAKSNMALYQVEQPLDKHAALALANQFGLSALDVPLYTKDPGVTEIENIDGGRQGEYAPYTDRALSWHTDGYYNAPDNYVRGMLLHCARPAKDGGVSSLLDPEIAYLRLRDENPDYIAALSQPDALTIPENVENGVLIRPAQTGPVFSIINGHLHMRFTARKRYIEWKPGATLERARAALTALLDDPNGPVIHHRMSAGQGLICNNVLHTRSAFKDGARASDGVSARASDGVSADSGRLFYRARFKDRVSDTHGDANHA